MRSRALLAFILLATAVLFPAFSVQGDNGCRAWASTLTPPSTIRVLLHQTGRVVRVPFRLYVARVVVSEWQSVAPQLRLAGAVAVKQYGWWKTMHPRRSRAGCFDVHDNTRDQIYRAKPARQIPNKVWVAVDSTWSWRLLSDGGPSTAVMLAGGRLMMTGYRTGTALPCASDATGWKLYARSAKRCAAGGWSAEAILRAYYFNANLQL